MHFIVQELNLQIAIINIRKLLYYLILHIQLQLRLFLVIVEFSPRLGRRDQAVFFTRNSNIIKFIYVLLNFFWNLENAYLIQFELKININLILEWIDTIKYEIKTYCFYLKKIALSANSIKLYKSFKYF